MTKIAVEFAHPYKKHQPGDKADLDEQEAKDVVRSGHARFAKPADKR